MKDFKERKVGISLEDTVGNYNEQPYEADKKKTKITTISLDETLLKHLKIFAAETEYRGATTVILAILRKFCDANGNLDKNKLKRFLMDNL